MRISIMSDERIVTVILKAFLSDLGHEVVSTQSGGELLMTLDCSAQPIDLVIADLHRPGGEGVTFLQHLHQRSPETLIVLMTGYDPMAGYTPVIMYPENWVLSLSFLDGLVPGG